MQIVNTTGIQYIQFILQHVLFLTQFYYKTKHFWSSQTVIIVYP